MGHAFETNGQFNAESKVSRIIGSYPHMRGTLEEIDKLSSFLRFIPTHAGNSLWNVSQ